MIFIPLSNSIQYTLYFLWHPFYYYNHTWCLSRHLLLDFPTKIVQVFIISPIPATCSTHSNLHFISLIIFKELQSITLTSNIPTYRNDSFLGYSAYLTTLVFKWAEVPNPLPSCSYDYKKKTNPSHCWWRLISRCVSVPRHFLEFTTRFWTKNPSRQRSFKTFRNIHFQNTVVRLQNDAKLVDHPLSAARNCLLIVFRRLTYQGLHPRTWGHA
jgi:hypothetical protein